MSDSESGDSDVQDFKDLDMIFELARLEQQQQEEAERVRHRNYTNREQHMINALGIGEIALKAWHGQFGIGD
ncbi:hypothetical protein Tco_0235977 [Tanacetum coccineum]